MNTKVKLGRYTLTLCYTPFICTYMYTQAQRMQVIHSPHMKDVPKEMMISSSSIRLLHSVGEGTSTYFTSLFLSFTAR